MSRPTTSGSHSSTIDSNASTGSPPQIISSRPKASSSTYVTGMNSSSESSLQEKVSQDGQGNKLPDGQESTSHPQEPTQVPKHQQTPSTSTGATNLSGLVCNVHKCTGNEPSALVGATTTILGDKLYVFGGRVISRRRPQLSADLYELDLVRRHWTKIETSGDIPPPRYFHTVCALGDTKLICYGGMAPAPTSSLPQINAGPSGTTNDQSDTQVMSDIHIYDATTRQWTHVATTNTPQGRYAHCASVLPSSAMFTSANAPLSAIHHNPSSPTSPNHGSLGVALDGSGGAEMVVVGGQDSANHYIEQISVFNLRSFKWTNTSSLGRSCGAYRSVVAPLTSLPASKIGRSSESEETNGGTSKPEKSDSEPSMLIYSNYNFLDVKLELQVRQADGSLIEKPMAGQFSPPGLRFPNGGILHNHFVVSGTYLTSSKQEYALWALDLKTLSWSRIDAGGGIFSHGSWNRGVLWPRRNTFVIVGNRKRSLVEDYGHRRTNFSNVCMVELEAFGLYDNPRRLWPISNYHSISAPVLPSSVSLKSVPVMRPLSGPGIELGLLGMSTREFADMDLIAFGGERVPVNSYLLARCWGPFFVQLLRDSTTNPASSFQNDASSSSDGGTLRPGNFNASSLASRNSSITITPSINTVASAAPSNAPSSLTMNSTSTNATVTSKRTLDPPTPNTLPASSRPRQLYLPHTVLTIKALAHFLYTGLLPHPPHELCTPQILCSLLQIARPYRVDGLLEATVERLHQVLDGRNAAALFNAAAMAAGGGRGTGLAFSKEGEQDVDEISQGGLTVTHLKAVQRLDPNTSEPRSGDDTSSEVSGSDFSSITSGSDSDLNSRDGRKVVSGADEVWSGGVSCVVGLQKRGLRGLMEGRRARERGQTVARSNGGTLGTSASGNGPNGSVSANGTANGMTNGTGTGNGNGVGLGIA